jgi:phenylpropionate dioxygenase-like ring-hydroxylating dioxygenase large terminal subunit
MFMKNCWQVAAFSTEIVPGQLLPRTLCGEPVVIYRAADGHPVALEDRCPHRFAPLSKGVLIGDTLRCGYHGLCFGTDGRCTSIPGQSHIPPQAKVRTHPAIERHRLIWIWLGDARAADPDLVPDVYWMDSPDWIAADGYHHIRAHYRLLNDNLLDLSHETYVHARTIGNEAVAESPAVVRHENNSIRVYKEMPGCNPPPFYQYLARVPATATVNRWQGTLYLPPGYIVIDVGVDPVEQLPGSLRVEGRVINLITPETDTTSHYFWAFARNFRLDEPTVTEFIRASVSRTFDEDKDMLEGQQRVMAGETDPQFLMALKSDAGPAQGRRLLAKLMAKEREASVASAKTA